MMEHEKYILESWQTNALAWKNAIADNSIQSRVLVTNEAILNILVSLQGQHIWDLGCGEGWLCRALSDKGMNTFGTDGTAALIQQAATLGNQAYAVATYQQIVEKSFIPPHAFDTIVCNFSLFENEWLPLLLQVLSGYLNQKGKLVIQTLHPAFANDTLPYQDGWREGSWAGFSAAFKNAHPWYFRTIESWLALLYTHGFNLIQIKEPLHPLHQKPASIIFVGEKTAP